MYGLGLAEASSDFCKLSTVRGGLGLLNSAMLCKKGNSWWRNICVLEIRKHENIRLQSLAPHAFEGSTGNCVLDFRPFNSKSLKKEREGAVILH